MASCGGERIRLVNNNSIKSQDLLKKKAATGTRKCLAHNHEAWSLSTELSPCSSMYLLCDPGHVFTTWTSISLPSFFFPFLSFFLFFVSFTYKTGIIGPLLKGLLKEPSTQLMVPVLFIPSELDSSLEFSFSCWKACSVKGQMINVYALWFIQFSCSLAI